MILGIPSRGSHLQLFQTKANGRQRFPPSSIFTNNTVYQFSSTTRQTLQQNGIHHDDHISSTKQQKGSRGPGRRRVIAPAIVTFSLASACLYWYTQKSDSSLKIFDRPRFTPFKIVRREEVSPTSILLTLRPSLWKPDKANADPYEEQWRKGTWSVEAKQPQLQIARAYTPLPPIEGGTPGDLRFLIRREHKGEVSGYLHDLPVDAEVQLRGPNPEFELPDEVTDVIFLAGGTGIAPALQVAHSLLEMRKGPLPPKIRIVWASRKRADCVGYDAPITTESGKGAGQVVEMLQSFQKKYPDRLVVEYFVDEEGTFPDQKKISQMTKSRASIRMQPIASRIDSRLLFVSGPEGFVNFLAGPRKWEDGKETQGQLGGILGRMGLRDWKKLDITPPDLRLNLNSDILSLTRGQLLYDFHCWAKDIASVNPKGIKRTEVRGVFWGQEMEDCESSPVHLLGLLQDLEEMLAVFCARYNPDNSRSDENVAWSKREFDQYLEKLKVEGKIENISKTIFTVPVKRLEWNMKMQWKVLDVTDAGQ
ncbi:hypothetical protein G7Y89_g5647 [Cudoniella acicularis]|uniref:FAD-binding FR-type domain-containing protein n=1 Tax=Cudoniella acicularis TaxID=354080 RepID=A0A8H4RM31_9HELO|nr:hypothetical protein G7Y89_g5647 [Cudoniella acicularis]